MPKGLASHMTLRTSVELPMSARLIPEEGLQTLWISFGGHSGGILESYLKQEIPAKKRTVVMGECQRASNWHLDTGWPLGLKRPTSLGNAPHLLAKMGWPRKSPSGLASLPGAVSFPFKCKGAQPPMTYQFGEHQRPSSCSSHFPGLFWEGRRDGSMWARSPPCPNARAWSNARFVRF